MKKIALSGGNGICESRSAVMTICRSSKTGKKLTQCTFIRDLTITAESFDLHRAIDHKLNLPPLTRHGNID